MMSWVLPCPHQISTAKKFHKRERRVAIMLVKVQETYRVETEDEARKLIRDMQDKAGTEGYDVVKSTITKRYDKKTLEVSYIVVIAKDM